MQAYGLTDVGRTRSQNQDYLYSSSAPVGAFRNLFLVADGMGGHRAGDYASRFAVEHLVNYLEEAQTAPVAACLQNGIAKINYNLYQEAMKDSAFHGMGTTLVAATVEEDTLYVANIGDSRLYLYHNGHLRQITRDHSYVEELVALGKLERNSHDYLEQKNIITRAIGTEDSVQADLFEEQLEADDLFLMCSDGLSNMVSDEDISRILSSSDTLQQKVEQLIDSANRNGGKDNITVVLVDPQISEVKAC